MILAREKYITDISGFMTLVVEAKGLVLESGRGSYDALD